MAEVLTNGTGNVEYTADRATLRLTFEKAGKDRANTVGALSRSAAEAEKVLNTNDIETRSRHLAVHPRYENRRQVGVTASQIYHVWVHDREKLEWLTAMLLSLEPHRLTGPNWELSEARQRSAKAEARRLAVVDARERAEAYASALGLELGSLVRLTDEGAQPRMPVAYGGMPPPGGAGVPETQANVQKLNLEPELVDTQASCTTTWSLV